MSHAPTYAFCNGVYKASFLNLFDGEEHDACSEDEPLSLSKALLFLVKVEFFF